MENKEVHFLPDDCRVHVPVGTLVLEAARLAGIVLNASCGGAGSCRKCQVFLEPEGQEVLACQHKVDGDITVRIPEGSRFFEQKILESGIAPEKKICPVVCKYYLDLSPPCLEDLRSDAKRLVDELSPADPSEKDSFGFICPEVLRELPGLLRENEFSLTAVCHCGKVIAVEGGDTTDRFFGLAVDLGTTTVVAQLIDLRTGHVLATKGIANPQRRFGDDVISRIDYTRSCVEGRSILQEAVVQALSDLVKKLVRQAIVSQDEIYEMAVVGNSTMQHLLLGVPAFSIAQAPYVPVFSHSVTVPARTIGIHLHPQARLYLASGIAGHVGSDTLAVVVAAGLDQTQQTTVTLDIGTNGEMVLTHKGHLTVCSAAAGPALEGARILHGTSAIAGAIEQVRLSPTQPAELITIYDQKPVGICGSGIIDLTAELLRIGLMDSSGRMIPADELGDSIGLPLKERVIEYEGSPAFLVVSEEQSGQGKAIVFTQRDVRQVQLAVAAIRSGLTILMENAGVQSADVDVVYVAGAFGNTIRPESALRLGLIPPVGIEKIQSIGNAALAGAGLFLLNRAIRQRSCELAQQIRYQELAGESRFQDIFSEALFFPNTI